MPAIERDAPRDMDRPLKHQHSGSIDHGRALVPMWDSSDPERAPPPLPLNPQSPGVSRTGTSTAIQSAHAAMAEKARESAALVPHLAKRIADTSPERPALRPSSHRRMESLQPSSVKDMSLMIEAGRDSLQSTPRSPEKLDRPTTPQRKDTRDIFTEPKEDKQERSTAGTPTPGPSLTPIIRPTAVRRPHQSILGENTPPQSATMLALQNMSTQSAASTPAPKEPETPLANITNGSKALEMSLLSRRSRDNATDLLSLKEATNSRDEDIRKSSGNSSPTFAASFDRESLLSTPSLISDTSSPATVALLEKIIREMGTKEGQETLLNRLTDLADRLSGMATAGKVEELARFVKSNQQHAVVPAASGGRGGGGDGGIRDRNWSFGDDDDMSQRGALDFLHAAASASQTSRMLPGQEGRAERSADVLNDDVLKAIRGVKDSVAQGGGLTAEVKALVRELRGEVLGMGREIGRRLDEVAEKNAGQPEAVTKAEMTKVVEEGLSDMSLQMNSLLREHRRQSAAAIAARECSIDYKEIYNSMRTALKETQAAKPRTPELRREDVIHAVKDAWEKYKPEIEIQQIGLERDEVLACLQEGLRAYAPRDERPPGATSEEVFQAVMEGLKHYKPPKIEIPAALSRDEILDAVRECLEEFEFPVAPSAMGPEVTREDMLDAVKEGLQSFDFPLPTQAPSASNLTRDDVLDAVNQGLQSIDFSAVSSNALVPQSVSKGDVSDAVKSGLKSLDLSSDIMDAVKEGLDGSDLPTNVMHAVMQGLQSFDFSAAVSTAIPRPDLSRVDVADAVKEGIECLDLNNSITQAVQQSLKGFDFSSAYSSALVPRAADVPPVDVADAVKEGLKSVDLSKDVTEAVKKALEGFDFSTFSSALVPRPDLSRVDVVDAVKEGLDTVDLSRDVADAVKRVLETFDFPTSTAPDVTRSDLSRVDVIDAVKEGLDSFDLSADLGGVVRKELESFDFSAVQSTALVAQGGNNDDVIQRLQEIKSFLQAEIKAASEETKQNAAANVLDTERILDATKDGFENLRQDIEDYVDRAKEDSGPEGVTDELLRTLDSFRDELAELVTRSSDSSRAMLKEELEALRDTVNSSMVPALPQSGNNKEILEALHDGLGSIRSEIGTRPIAGLTEILDALQEGLGDIRTSINNLRDKPADLTANDEILDALKEGLDTVRSEIDTLREETRNDRALATIDDNSNAVVPAEQMVKHDDIKNLEVLITQLGVKVEAMESAPKPTVTSLSKEDLADMEKTLHDVAASVAGMPNREPFEVLEESIRKIQQTVDELATKEAAAPPPPPERSSTDPASREDVEAIETILRNTKSRLDDLIDGEQAVRKDHIDTLETMVLEARESVSGIASQFDGISRKEHIDALEALLLETRESLGGVATQMDVLSRKEDVAMVESLVTQIIGAFDEMKERHEKALEDPEKITKTDVEAVEAVCIDTKSLIEHIQKVDLVSLPSKEDVEALEIRLGDLKERLDAHADASAKASEERQAETVGVGLTVTEVKTLLEEFQTLVRSKLEDGARGIDSIHTLLDTLSENVQKNDSISDDVKEVLDTLKLEFEDSKTGLVGVKIELDEKLQTTADVLLAKLDERMTELMTKHEELQLLQDDRAAKTEARDVEMEAAVSGTKAIAEELKSLVDTLGTAVTDSMEKMEEASKTVFERVEELVTKSDENHTDGKAEHQLTREQVQEAIGKVEGLQGQVSEYQPKILETVQEVMLVLAQHYEHLRTSTLAIQERVEHPLLPPPPEKYDDTVLIEKLDTLVGHTQVADKAFEHLGTLDQVHAQVKATAAELAAFLAAQTQRIADEHEDREKTLQEATIALERRLEEKEQVESLIASLREEEARIKESITVTLPEEQSKINEQFLVNLQTEEARLKEATTTLIEEQAQLKEVFLNTLKEEQARLMETNVALKEEQDQMKETFLATLKEEQARLMETNVALKEEQDKLKEAFLANLREEESRLKDMNDALRDEQQVLKDTFLANLREEESLLKEVNAGLREEQERLRETFLANFKEEEQRLREANEALRQEQEQIKVTLKEEQERFKIELLANLMEEEARLKDANAALREEQELLRTDFLATLKEDESRIKDSLHALRSEQDNLARQKTRLTADLSSLDTALRIRREELHDMEARAESLERRILEGVMDHSRVLLMAKTNRAAAAAGGNGRDSMSRKRVSSSSHNNKTTETTTTPTRANQTTTAGKPRSAITMAMSARSKANSNTPTNGGTPIANRRILSLSQITNNVPAGGMKRSQSVRTPGGAAAARGGGAGRGLRKSSWASSSVPPVPAVPAIHVPAAAAAVKGYGDLEGDDKENVVVGVEGDEDAWGQSQHEREREMGRPDIVISGADEQQDAADLEPVDVLVTPSVEGDAYEHDHRGLDHEEEDDDRFSDLGETERDDARSLRRSSHGTTVITPADEQEEEWSEHEGGEGLRREDDSEGESDDVDDAASDWTESVVGRESDVGMMEREGSVPVAAAS
ncbi:hypothetical protein NEMBOFW57_010216 [Staphylotrichum longicolle]|uniref:Chromosome segregation ATPase family protein n=1 Tax=Staphylotrichum longicolle TaxID=669026 RepID=A0AAD4HVD1_9PEZI|nr:hypothetical protein NEMBOFW57_010216 [Staphylotrichum longicolle]